MVVCQISPQMTVGEYGYPAVLQEIINAHNF